MELIEALKKEWGVNERQAKGGVGAVLYVVRDRVSRNAFREVSDVLPDARAWMAISPEGDADGERGVVDEIFRTAVGDELTPEARMHGHFHSLGIGRSLVEPFTKQVLVYLEAHLSGDSKAQVGGVLAEFQA